MPSVGTSLTPVGGSVTTLKAVTPPSNPGLVTGALGSVRPRLGVRVPSLGSGHTAVSRPATPLFWAGAPPRCTVRLQDGRSAVRAVLTPEKQGSLKAAPDSQGRF